MYSPLIVQAYDAYLLEHPEENPAGSQLKSGLTITPEDELRQRRKQRQWLRIPAGFGPELSRISSSFRKMRCCDEQRRRRRVHRRT